MGMNLQASIVHALSVSAQEVFSTMLGVDIGSFESYVEATTPDASGGVVALIGMAGSWTGTGTVSCSPQVACRICRHMLMSETDSINEEVLDAVAELTNMIIGGAKTQLELELGSLGLSIPTVIYGRNFKTKSAIHSEWVAVRFQWDDEPVEVKLCMARTTKPAHLPIHIPTGAACSVDV
jgi:chemotaxis protein CheX